MMSLKNTFAALGFVCFSSLALLPVSMTVCGPITSRILHAAKKIHRVKPALFPELGVAQPVRTSVKRDMLRAEADPLRNLFEQIGGRILPVLDADGSGGRLIKRFIRSVKVSTFVFQPVLNL
ncbi:MAG TPA: hypothetical protein VGL70_22300 [Candidatus Binatia bacterium]|jgi:hypothetical protein